MAVALKTSSNTMRESTKNWIDSIKHPFVWLKNAAKQWINTIMNPLKSRSDYRTSLDQSYSDMHQQLSKKYSWYNPFRLWAHIWLEAEHLTKNLLSWIPWYMAIKAAKDYAWYNVWSDTIKTLTNKTSTTPINSFTKNGWLAAFLSKVWIIKTWIYAGKNEITDITKNSDFVSLLEENKKLKSELDTIANKKTTNVQSSSNGKSKSSDYSPQSQLGAFLAGRGFSKGWWFSNNSKNENRDNDNKPEIINPKYTNELDNKSKIEAKLNLHDKWIDETHIKKLEDLYKKWYNNLTEAEQDNLYQNFGNIRSQNDIKKVLGIQKLKYKTNYLGNFDDKVLDSDDIKIKMYTKTKEELIDVSKNFKEAKRVWYDELSLTQQEELYDIYWVKNNTELLVVSKSISSIYNKEYNSLYQNIEVTKNDIRNWLILSSDKVNDKFETDFAVLYNIYINKTKSQRQDFLQLFRSYKKDWNKMDISERERILWKYNIWNNVSYLSLAIQYMEYVIFYENVHHIKNRSKKQLLQAKNKTTQAVKFVWNKSKSLGNWVSKKFKKKQTP